MKSLSFRFPDVEQLKDYQKRSRVYANQLIDNFVITALMPLGINKDLLGFH